MTERRETEEALRESKQRFRDVAEAASEWIWETDAEHRITFVSDRINECGSKEGAMHRPLGRNGSIVDPDGTAWKKHRARCDAHHPFKNFEYQIRDRAGEIRTCQISGKPVFDGDRKFMGYRGVGWDVTEKKRAEAAAERSQRLFAAAFHNGPGMKSLFQPEDGKIADLNEAWCKTFGYSREEAVGRTLSDLGIWVDPTHRDDLYAELDSNGRVNGHECQIRTRDGRILHVIVYSEVLDLDGESLVLTVTYDQTERKEAEEALRDSERRFRTIAAIASDWIWESGPDHRYTFVAGRTGDIETLKGANLTGRRIVGDVLDDRSPQWQQHIADIEAYRPFKNYVDTYRDKAGEIRIVQLSGEPFFDKDGAFGGYRGTSTDLTELRRTEEALNESKKRLSDMLAIAPDAIIAVDANLNIDTFNKGAETVFGYSPAEVIGRPLDILLPERFRAQHLKHVRSFERSEEASRLMGGRGEIVGLRRDGSEFPAEASISKLELPDGFCFTVLLHDISDRKKMENALISAKEQAEIASESKSEFLASMSHELRTPLNAILGFSDILQREMFGPISQKRYLEYAKDIHDSGNHLLELISDLLDISKVESGRFDLVEEPVELRALADRSVAFVKGLAGTHGVRMDNKVQPDLPKVSADPRLLRQILVNLLTNAVKFTPTGGSVKLTAAIVDGGSCQVVVTDTGVGIAPEDLRKVLEPFGLADNRIPDRPEGSGLGLALVKRFAELHDGTVCIESEPKRGTKVTLTLPPNRVLEGLQRAS